MHGLLPSFLGLGTQKGGTTTLHDLLLHHPQIYLPACKEVQFFSLAYQRGLAWYASHYEPASAGQVCGDISPYYLFHPAAPERIRDCLPQVRLVVLLRDPVERALSGYFHSRRLGLEHLPLEEALAAEQERLAGAGRQLISGLESHRSHQVHSYLSRSCYGPQLGVYEALFEPEQLLVLRSEDLFSEPQRVWRELLAFLQLDPCPLPLLPRPSNAGSGEAAGVSAQVRDWLREQLADTYALMADRYGISW